MTNHHSLSKTLLAHQFILTATMEAQDTALGTWDRLVTRQRAASVHQLYTNSY